MNNLFINRQIWNNFTEDEMNIYIDNVYNYYKEKGFPYFSTDENFRNTEYDKFINYDDSNIFKNDILNQTMHGLSLAWSYFPHSFNVKCNNKLTPLEAYNNDEIFKKVIIRRIKMGSNMSDNGIRKMIKIFTNVQSVSNFRPTTASAIYKNYNNKIVWDMSGGFGGRLLGAIKSNVEKYICTEPSTLSYEGLIKLNNDFGNKNYEFYKIGSEDFIPNKESLDLCFTSPPYFNTEKYSNEDTQSCNKFQDKENWLNNFLKKTFENCYFGLKNNSHMLINIANVPAYKKLEEDTIKIATETGFILNKTLKYSLSNVSMGVKKEKFKYEPIFDFIKIL